MPRKTFLNRHTKAVTPDTEIAAKFLLHWQTADLYYSANSFPRLTSRALFGNDLPVEFEIGCGSGEFLCGQASVRSDCNFIGLDINLKSLYVGVEIARERSLENIKFIKAPIQYLYPLMPSATYEAIYLHFPDPLLRPKYRKRKVLNEAFMAEIDRILVHEGLFSIVTDNEELFEDILALIEGNGHFRKEHQERYLLGFEPAAKSRYQQYWEAHDKTIFRLVLRKAR